MLGELEDAPLARMQRGEHRDELGVVERVRLGLALGSGSGCSAMTRERSRSSRARRRRSEMARLHKMRHSQARPFEPAW